MAEYAHGDVVFRTAFILVVIVIRVRRCGRNGVRPFRGGSRGEGSAFAVRGTFFGKLRQGTVRTVGEIVGRAGIFLRRLRRISGAFPV